MIRAILISLAALTLSGCNETCPQSHSITPFQNIQHAIQGINYSKPVLPQLQHREKYLETLSAWADRLPPGCVKEDYRDVIEMFAKYTATEIADFETAESMPKPPDDPNTACPTIPDGRDGCP